MISLLADQNFNEHIVDGLMRRLPILDIVVAREVDLAEAQDPAVLHWAGLPMPGVFLVSDEMPVGRAVEELLIAVQCLSPEECEKTIRFFPL